MKKNKNKSDALYDKLKETFEKLLVEQFVICELRDIWRKRAGLPTKCIDDSIVVNEVNN